MGDLFVCVKHGLGELLIDLQTLLQRKVDLVTKNALHPRIYAQVLKEAQPL